MKKLIKSSVLASAALFAFAIAAPTVVIAQSAKEQEAQTKTREAQTKAQERKQTGQENKEIAQANAPEKREEAKTKSEDNKLQACEKREDKINKLMARLADRGNKQLDVFTKISDRTQAFYDKKGKELSNYEALVDEVEAKKLAAEKAVAEVNGTSMTFKCDGTDPKGAAASFKESRNVVQTALKDYKTAVKNLIVGVKSVQSTESKPPEVTTPEADPTTDSNTSTEGGR